MFPNSKEPDQEQSDRIVDRLRRQFGCSSWMLWIVLLVLFAPWVLRTLLGGEAPGMEISYTEFREQVESGNVALITVSGDQIQGELQEPIQQVGINNQTVSITSFTTYYPSFGDEELFPLLREQGVEVDTNPEQTFSLGLVLLNLLPFLLFIGLGYYILRRMRAQGSDVLSMGKSRAQLYDQEKKHTTFDDVAGSHGPKRELQEIVQYLKDPEKFQRLGAEIPKGVLLVGPPGTGKTLLARAVAGEAGVPFFSITGSDFMEMFVGVGASRVRDLFKEAKQAAPSIIFIDELDSIGRRRGAGLGGGHDEREQTLNQMLSELDGFQPTENVIVMAATNRPDILDPALLRPGRFDRQVTVDLPLLKDREEILHIHARNKPMAENVDLEKVARGTPGFSGADLANLLNEAALLAARRDKQIVETEDISDARDKVLMGLERDSMVLSEDETRLIAYHEAGHAVVAAVLPNADPVHKVTIVPRGRAMGVTQQLPEKDRYLYPRDYMLDRMAVMMGGRAAEDLALNTMTSGAENDFKQATALARKMVLDWGMSERLGHVAYGDDNDQVFLGEEISRRREYSETTAREVDEEIRSILDEAYNRAVYTLREQRQSLDDLVAALVEREVITGEEVKKIIMGNQKSPALEPDGKGQSIP